MSLPLTLARDDSSAPGRNALTVAGRREVSQGVVELALRRPDGSRLPDWAPGAHIDLLLPDGTARQYSLCGDRWDASTYRIAVQREPEGRGGSAYVHDRLGAGDLVGFGGPRNNFRLAPGEDHLFIAGGIGITPIMPMIRQAELLSLAWRLLYLGRSRARLAYLDELVGFGDRVSVHCFDELGIRAELDAWRPDDPRVRVYACGPERLLDAVQTWVAPVGGFPARVERFTAASADAGRAASRFEVVAARSGVSVDVDSGESIVTALKRVGVEVLTSCAQGVCGTCETDVLEGVPDHRDTLLDDHERTENLCMFPCVSRCKGERLVLDL